MEALFNSLAYFIPVGDAEKEIISTLFTEKQFKKGEPSLQEGKVCRHVAFIIKGLMRYYLTQDGEEKTLWTRFAQQPAGHCWLLRIWESFFPMGNEPSLPGNLPSHMGNESSLIGK